jgi:hypothetical protein
MTTPNQSPYSGAPAPKAGGFNLRMADALVAVGGLLIFLFSFAPFVSAGGYSTSAWHVVAPVVVFVVLAGVLLVATAFLDTFWHRGKQYVGVNRHHVQVGLALYTLVTLIGFALASTDGGGFGWGAIFMLIGSLVATAGALLNHFNLMQDSLPIPSGRGRTAPTGYAPPVQATPVDPATTPVDPTV